MPGLRSSSMAFFMLSFSVLITWKYSFMSQLKALLARDIWNMNEYFQVINTLNDSMKKAIELLRKPGMNFPKR